MKFQPGWYPLKLARSTDGAITVHWQDLKGASFKEPFFEDTVRWAAAGTNEAAAARARRVTTVWQRTDPVTAPATSLPPTGFIFHTSRSGSTLLTQLLMCLEGTLALSEPPIIDDVLQLPDATPDKLLLFQEMIYALGQRRSAEDRYFFLKYDSWHLPWFPLIKAAFPDTPCYFIYRDPREILWSHHRQRGSQMVPGLRDATSLDLVSPLPNPADLDGYAARVLESIFLAALPLVQAGSLIPVDHQELSNPVAVIERLGFQLTAAEQTLVRQRSQNHSKHRSEVYQPEQENAIPAALRQRFDALAAPVLLPAYQMLPVGVAK